MVERAHAERSPPQGTVTFLFTDIENSTRVLERLDFDEYGRVLETHRELLLCAINEAEGLEVDGEGESLFAVFASAAAAIDAAVDAQRDFASHPAFPVPRFEVRGHDEIDRRVTQAYAMFVEPGVHTFEAENDAVLLAPARRVGMGDGRHRRRDRRRERLRRVGTRR